MEKSPFDRLPRELRDKIYEYAVVHEDGIKIRCDKRKGKRMPRVASPHHATLALAMTCHQMHEETIDLYYEKNSFYFPPTWQGVELLKTFCKSLKDTHYSKLRHIVFRAPDAHLSERGTPKYKLLSNWSDLVHELLQNDGTLLPGPISVGGRFTFDHSTSTPCPPGELYVVLDMNDLLKSMHDNQEAVRTLNRELVKYWEESQRAMDRISHWMQLLEKQLQWEISEHLADDDDDAFTPRSGWQDGNANNNTGGVAEADKDGNGDEDKEMHGSEDNAKRDTYDWTSNNENDDDTEDGKMVLGLNLGDHFWKKATGLGIQ